MPIINIITHHGDFYKSEDFPVDDVTAKSVKDSLRQSSYVYDISLERAEILTTELLSRGKTEHGWSTVSVK